MRALSSTLLVFNYKADYSPIPIPIAVNYQQLPVNASKTAHRQANFQRDGGMAFYNQGSRPNYLSSIEPIRFRNRSIDLNKVHSQFTDKAVNFLSEILPEDLNAPRALWEKVFDDGAKERFISNVSGHISKCKQKEIIKRQIAIFREVSDDLATRLEKATGVKGYAGISELSFNGTHNGMAKNEELYAANGMGGTKPKGDEYNGGPIAGTTRSDSGRTSGRYRDRWKNSEGD